MSGVDTGPIRERIKFLTQDLGEDVSYLLEVADRLSEIEEGEFIVAQPRRTGWRDQDSELEMLREPFEAYVGRIKGSVTHLGEGRFVIDLDKPAAVIDMEQRPTVYSSGNMVGEDNRYALIDGRGWAADTYLHYEGEPVKEMVDEVVPHVFYPHVEAEMDRGEEAYARLHEYGPSFNDYKQLCVETEPGGVEESSKGGVAGL